MPTSICRLCGLHYRGAAKGAAIGHFVMTTAKVTQVVAGYLPTAGGLGVILTISGRGQGRRDCRRNARRDWSHTSQ